MSLFLAAAAGFLSGKAKLAQEKREEERSAREEERLLDRQKRLYQFQYDIQRRSTLDEEAGELSKRVQALVRTAGIDEGTAINVVQFGAYDDVFNAAVQGKLNPVAVQAMFGNSDDTAPAAMPEPDTYTTEMAEPARRPAVEPQGIFLPESPQAPTSSQVLDEARKFDSIVAPIVANMFPQETFSQIFSNEGSVFLRSGNTAALSTANRIRLAAKEAYDKLKVDPDVGPQVALHRIANFINTTIPRVTSRGLDVNEVEALILLPLQELTFRPLFIQGPVLPPPSIAPTPEAPVAGAGPEDISWRDNIFP